MKKMLRQFACFFYSAATEEKSDKQGRHPATKRFLDAKIDKECCVIGASDEAAHEKRTQDSPA